MSTDSLAAAIAAAFTVRDDPWQELTTNTTDALLAVAAALRDIAAALREARPDEPAF